MNKADLMLRPAERLYSSISFKLSEVFSAVTTILLTHRAFGEFLLCRCEASGIEDVTCAPTVKPTEANPSFSILVHAKLN